MTATAVRNLKAEVLHPAQQCPPLPFVRPILLDLFPLHPLETILHRSIHRLHNVSPLGLDEQVDADEGAQVPCDLAAQVELGNLRCEVHPARLLAFYGARYVSAYSEIRV